VRVSAWAIYDVFEVLHGEHVFVGVVSDAQWQSFCAALGFEALAADPRFGTNQQRVLARDVLLPTVRERLATFTQQDLLARLEAAGLPFAPIGRPEDLFDDPHLQASGGLAATTLPGGHTTRLPILPLELSGGRATAAHMLPGAGEHTAAILATLGVGAAELAALEDEHVI
jgi:crotonobetainyl-CoA:carnitine CoA-transferase CaiB-like acyl-CoA transferase